jgi:capreomycidine synthase
LESECWLDDDQNFRLWCKNAFGDLTLNDLILKSEIMYLEKAELEDWMRDYYFDCEIDLGSSGVYPYTFGDICNCTGLNFAQLEAVSLADSMTVGVEALRQALADRYGDGNAEHVMVANGSNEVLFHVLSTLLQTGDEVIALDPIYHALDAVPIAKQCNVKRWSMAPDNNFRVDFNELRSLISEKTKLIAVNFPHNPTGVSITSSEMDELIALAASVDAYLLWDAAFEELVEKQSLGNPFLRYNKAISVGTMSKSFGMPGLRVGWCFANQEVIQKSVQLRDYTTLYVSPIIELIATKVIQSADVFINNRLDAVAHNRMTMQEWIKEHDGVVEWSAPDGGVSCLIKIKEIPDVAHFCRTLAKEQDVMMVPGSCFGLPSYARLGFGEESEKFHEGLLRLSKHISKYLPV